MKARTSQISLERSRRIHAGMRSGPPALLIFRSDSKALTPDLLIWMSGMSGYGDEPLSESARCSEVNIDLNWLLRASTLFVFEM